jgi:Zn-finger nucleic acid-binding protein
MEIDEMNIVLLELKYCERCGGLWLRPRGCEDVLCATCSAQMAEFPGSCKHTNLRLALRTTIQVDGESREVLVMCGEGGNA